MDVSKLPPQTIKRLQELEQKRPEYQMLNTMKDVADMVQELVNIADDNQTDSLKRVQGLGALVADIREEIIKLNKKEAPEAPDYAKPIVAAVDKLASEIKKLEVNPVFKPTIDVKAPEVVVPETKIDLTKIEKLLKIDLPNAFEKAISLMPKVEIPETDNKPLIEIWQSISEQLQSIDNATRMKPQFPNTLKVTNPDGSLIGVSTLYKTLIDKTTTTDVVYVGKADIGTATSSNAWLITKIDKSSSPVSITYANAGAFTAVWNDRVSEVYS